MKMSELSMIDTVDNEGTLFSPFIAFCNIYIVHICLEKLLLAIVCAHKFLLKKNLQLN